MTLAALEALHRLESRLGIELPAVDTLAAAIEVTHLAQRQSAFHAGDACPRIFIVRTGLLKQLYIKEDGSEWIKSFTGPGDLFACLEALAPGGRTSFASVAIEPSVVESIDFSRVERLGEQHLAWQKAIRLAFQYLAELKVRRERDLLMLSAQELYRKFAAESPAPARRVPQKDLAAFLGVTPVGLNRIIRRHGAAIRR
ncbi:MAG TPA: Crp/Fnr family transcriptional regulator [Burkholderiaceae bacterium]|nr:Crp/Fnr family transcriptional regulator [Burkholderiaceae bacterium]